MTTNEIIACLTDCFAEHQSKTVTRVICVDYIPITLWKNNIEYYCVIESHNGSECSIKFKAHYSSDNFESGLLRDCNLQISKTLAIIRKDSEKLASMPTDSEVKEIVETFPYENLHNILTKIRPLADAKAIVEPLAEGIDELKTFQDRELETGFRTAFANVVDKIYDLVKQVLILPDHIEDLIELLGEDRIRTVQNISEVYAKNILTREDYQDNTYMIVANCELMHLFFGKFSPAKRFYTASQRIYQALPEFVPLLMKFSGVPNPILDVNNESSVLEKLKEGFRFLQNTELVTNKCAFNGSLIDGSSDAFDYSEPDTYQTSRIVYGLASDIDEIYSSSNIAIIPQIDGLLKTEHIIYSSDLAVGILQSTLIAAMMSLDLASGFIPQRGFTDIMKLGIYSGDDSTQQILYIGALPEINKHFEATRTSVDYADIALLRGVLSSRSNKANLAEAIALQTALHNALAECSQDLLLFRDMGVNLDED